MRSILGIVCVLAAVGLFLGAPALWFYRSVCADGGPWCLALTRFAGLCGQGIAWLFGCSVLYWTGIALLKPEKKA